jgi:glycosidase
MPIRIAAALLALALGGAVCAAEIDRVEPPFWWTGFRHGELQILLHGDGIGSLDVDVAQAGVSLERVARTDNDHYLFLYLDVADAQPGEFDIVLRGGGERITQPYELRRKNQDPAHVTGFTASDAIYLITPDRYVDGDPSNDTVAGYGDAQNRDDAFGRHGGDLAGIESSLDYVAGMGFTAIWLNPVLENRMPESSYHGYAITDFYKVDPRFGSNDDYRQLAATARAKGIKLIMDMIVNHAGSGHWWMHDLPTADWLNSPEKHAITTHARTTNLDPYASNFDKAAHADGWFVSAMPDLNQRNPLLADYLTQNSIWWIETLGLSGIRMDTQPYPDKHYMAEWSRRIVEEYPDINLTGEDWTANPVIVSYWQRGQHNRDGFESYMPSMLDFPLQIAVHDALTANEPDWGSVWTPAYEMLANDILYPDPFDLVIFPDNHDMSRIYTQLGEDYDRYRMAMVYYATMRGIPQFYYGTEVLMSNPGTESHGVIRSEFPGGWPDHAKSAFTGKGLTKREREAQAFLRKLLTWRRGSDAVHRGKLMQFTPIGNVYAYFRYTGDETVMVAFNRGDEPASIDTARFAERLGDAHTATDVLGGKRVALDGTLELPPRAVLLLELDGDAPRAALDREPPEPGIYRAAAGR